MSHDPHHSDGAVPSSISVADPTCVWHDSAAEIHMVVVGPVANNVYVLRCRLTGEAVLIDAANEHEQLLELCRRLDVRSIQSTCPDHLEPQEE